MNTLSANFGFLAKHDPLFLELAVAAERAFASDPNSTLIKLRQFGEALAQDLASKCGILFTAETSQADLLYKISREIRLDPVVKDLFHTLRIEGNRAAHEFQTKHKEAMAGLKVARKLAVWFHRSFGGQQGFKPGPFTPPADPSHTLRELRQQIEALKGELAEAHERADSSAALAELLQKEKANYAELTGLMEQDAEGQALQAKEREAELQAQQAVFQQRIDALQGELAKQLEAGDQDATKAHQGYRSKARKNTIELDEETTRILVDLQLQDAGWEADTQDLTWKKGARPEKGCCKAIAEWPTTLKKPDGSIEKGWADYVLFHGLTAVGVVEAKKQNVNVAEKVRQAERYSRGFAQSPAMRPAFEVAGRTVAWPDEDMGHYHIPFVYSCNGRPYNPLQDLKELSGIWHRDVRDPSNLRAPR